MYCNYMYIIKKSDKYMYMCTCRFIHVCYNASAIILSTIQCSVYTAQTGITMVIISKYTVHVHVCNMFVIMIMFM